MTRRQANEACNKHRRADAKGAAQPLILANISIDGRLCWRTEQYSGGDGGAGHSLSVGEDSKYRVTYGQINPGTARLTLFPDQGIGEPVAGAFEIIL